MIADPLDTFEQGTGPFYALPDDGADPCIFARIEPRHLNATGVVHGGLLMTMADLALAYTARRGAENERTVTVSLNCEFLEGGREGEFLQARAEILRRTGALVFGRAQVKVEERVLLNCSAVMRRVRLAPPEQQGG